MSTPLRQSSPKSAKKSVKVKGAVLGDVSNTDISKLLAVAASIQEQMGSMSVATSDDEEDDSDNGSNNNDADMEPEAAACHASSGDGEELDSNMESEMQAEEDSIENLKASLRQARAERDRLKSQLASSNSSNRSDDVASVPSVPRPAGTAGADFSIQEAMGLAGSEKKDKMYQALQCRVKDFMGYCRIEYDKTWKEVPAKTKCNLFEAVRTDQPYLSRYQNDWATEELAKQYLKNKCKNAYRNGWLEVPAKYAYLKRNAAQRSTSGSWSSKAKAIREACEQKKAEKAAKKGKGKVQSRTRSGAALKPSLVGISIINGEDMDIDGQQ